MRFLSLVFLSLIIFSGCKSEEEKKAEELKKEVHALHDELMKETEDLRKLKIKLLKKKDNADNAIERAGIRTAASLAGAAESFMNDWMAQYNEPKIDEDVDGAIKYYEKQKKELERMEEQVDKAQEKIEKWLDKLKK